MSTFHLCINVNVVTNSSFEMPANYFLNYLYPIKDI